MGGIETKAILERSPVSYLYLAHKGGGLQINFANHKSAISGLKIFFRFASTNVSICGPYLYCDLRFADPVIFCGLTTSANTQTHHFLLTIMLSFKFKDDLWLLGQLHSIS